MSGGEWLSSAPLYIMPGLVALTVAVIRVMPRLARAVPAPLVGIAVVAGLVIALGLDVPRVGDLASIRGGLPSFHIPMVPLTFETLEIILPYAVILAAPARNASPRGWPIPPPAFSAAWAAAR